MAAIVKIQGFEWILTGDKINFKNFLEYLQLRSGDEVDKKVIVISKNSDDFIGVVITINDMKSFCQIKREHGKFEFTNKTLEDGANMADFNFFVINPETGKGLYQYYHKSCSLSQFNYFIKKRFNAYKSELIDLAINKKKLKMDIDSLTQKEELKIRQDYKCYFRYSPILQQDSFDDYVSKLKEINLLEFEVATIDVFDSNKVALTKYAKRVTHKMFFPKNNGSLSLIKSSIKSLSKDFVKAKVKGIDPDNHEAIYKLFNNPEQFAEYNYDEIAKNIRLNSKDLTQSLKESLMIKEILNLYRSSKAISDLINTPWQ